MSIPGLHDGEYTLKLGRSFRSYRNGGHPFQEAETFHSLRYDFKPASIDPTQVATLAFEPMNKMTVIAPTGDEGRQTVFKGSNKPSERECVLIYDHQTGELTLERLTHSIQVKKTREEKRSSARPSTPSLNELYGAVGQSPPAASSSSSSSAKSSTKHGKGQNGASSSQAFNGRLSAHVSSATGFRSQSPQPASNSSALISNHQQPHANSHQPDNSHINSLSDSSSSDGSSSSDDDDDQEDARKLETSMNGFSNGGVNGKASPASSSNDDSSSSDSSSDSDDDLNDSKPSPAASSNGHSNGSLSMPNLSSFSSMPTISQLGSSNKCAVTNDLQLSEDSDSD